MTPSNLSQIGFVEFFHLGIKNLGIKCDGSNAKRDIKSSSCSCRFSTRFCQYIGLLGLHAWTLQGCQMSWRQMLWRQMLWRQMLWRHMVYSQRRDNHHRAPRTPQHAEKVLQTQHPLLSIYWAQGRRKVTKSGGWG